MKIKICGMRERCNIASVASLRPDYMGFIFYERSLRYAGGMPAEALDVLYEDTIRVGVFVNAAYREIAGVVEKYRLDMVQLHGDEPPELCRKLRRAHRVIKALGVASADDVRRGCERYGDAVDCLLFDACTPLYGGSGEKFEWGALAEATIPVPFFLSGGIGVEDARRIANLDLSGLHAVDLNSRFESAPGVKDVERLKEFIETVRNDKT